MKKNRKLICLFAVLLVFTLLLTACGTGNLGLVRVSPGGEAPGVAQGGGPHFSASLTRYSEPVAQSGWLELFLDEGSMTAQVRGFDDAEWFTLPQTSATPLANAGAAAVELTVIVNGQRVSLNSQDHSVAFDNAVGTPVFDANDQPIGVRVDYLITPNEATALKSNGFDESDVAFVVRVQYTMQDGNFFVEADWENVSGNPDAFIESMGLMERFGALRNPGEDDFLLLPDGSGALLFPARTDQGAGFSQTAELHFTVYGEDPTNPLPSENSAGRIFRDADGEVLSAHAAVFGVRSRSTAFAAVVERGAAMATIVARQEIPGEPGIRQSAVGPRFAITPTTLGEDGGAFFRAAESFGGRNDEAEGFPIRICYRFFYGAGAANFSAMATSLREQLIITGVLSPTKTVVNPEWPLPLNLTLLGAEGNQALTTFEQALDILTRLNTRGVGNINLRYMAALGGPPERLRPLRRLGGRGDLAALQEFCHLTDISLFLDADLLPGRGAVDLAGNALPMRGMEGVVRSVRGFIVHLGPLQAAGFSLGDIGSTLAADYRAGLHREQVKAQLNLGALSTQRQIMMDTGFLHVVRTANVVVNLPLRPQLPTSVGERPRYEGVPLLPMILRGSVDFSGPALNLEDEPEQAFLHSIAFGACPALVWTATAAGEDDPLHFEAQVDLAVDYFTRANAALGDLRRERITAYAFDADVRVSTTRFSNGAVIYVNFSQRDVILNDISIPAGSFVRIG